MLPQRSHSWFSETGAVYSVQIYKDLLLPEGKDREGDNRFSSIGFARVYSKTNVEDIDPPGEEHAVKALMYGLTRKQEIFPTGKSLRYLSRERDA